jgi:transcriptional regulator with XRE-family HTH domain
LIKSTPTMEELSHSVEDASPAGEPLGARIRRLRTERGIGQERLAIESGVDQSGLSKFERGTANRALSEAALRRIAAALEITYERLVADTRSRTH